MSKGASIFHQLQRTASSDARKNSQANSGSVGAAARGGCGRARRASSPGRPGSCSTEASRLALAAAASARGSCWLGGGGATSVRAGDGWAAATDGVGGAGSTAKRGGGGRATVPSGTVPAGPAPFSAPASGACCSRRRRRTLTSRRRRRTRGAGGHTSPGAPHAVRVRRAHGIRQCARCVCSSLSQLRLRLAACHSVSLASWARPAPGLEPTLAGGPLPCWA